MAVSTYVSGTNLHPPPNMTVLDGEKGGLGWGFPPEEGPVVVWQPLWGLRLQLFIHRDVLAMGMVTQCIPDQHTQPPFSAAQPGRLVCACWDGSVLPIKALRVSGKAFSDQ